MLPRGPIYTMKTQREKKTKKARLYRRGKRAELTGEPIWQRGFDAVLSLRIRTSPETSYFPGIYIYIPKCHK